MATYAVIENEKVINVILADSKEVAEEVTGLQCIDCADGWDYENGIDENGFFPKPVIVDPVIVEPAIEEPAEDNG